MKELLLQIFCVITVASYAQKPTSIVDLTDDMQETSGLILVDGSFYTFNDSGGEAELYQIDTVSGLVARTIKVTDAKNKDWEAITADDEFIYIGDIGNNWGNRKDLVIYKCPIAGLKNGSLSSEKIVISYEDQKVFDNEPHKHEYDAEGLFVRDNRLYLISKNWANNESKIYEVPLEPGKYVLKVDSRIDVYGKVTDAFYNEIDTSLYLIGYGESRFITCLRGFDGYATREEITIPITSINGLQTEGICVQNDQVYYTSEKVKVFDALQARIHTKYFQEVVVIDLNGNKLKLSSKEKMASIMVEDKLGNVLSRHKNVSSKSKTLELEEVGNDQQLVIRITMKSGVEYKRIITTP